MSIETLPVRRRTIAGLVVPAAALVAWTCFLWLSRVRNVVPNEDLDGAGVVWRLAIVAVFVGLALWATFEARRGRQGPLVMFAVWTIGFWVVRGVTIALGDYSAGFLFIHALLAVVSIGLAWWVLKSSDRSI